MSTLASNDKINKENAWGAFFHLQNKLIWSSLYKILNLSFFPNKFSGCLPFAKTNNPASIWTKIIEVPFIRHNKVWFHLQKKYLQNEKVKVDLYSFNIRVFECIAQCFKIIPEKRNNLENILKPVLYTLITV